jgi:hypothetical protein
MNERSSLEMTPDTPSKTPTPTVDRDQHLDHSFDLVALVRAARERAQRQIEAFKNIAEYEVRKIYGQRTDIQYPKPGKKVEVSAKQRKEAEDSDTGESRHQKRVKKQEGGQPSLDFDSKQAKPEES